jgi:hypothetical protein
VNSKVQRQTVDLSAFPDLVVIYPGMRVTSQGLLENWARSPDQAGIRCRGRLASEHGAPAPRRGVGAHRASLPVNCGAMATRCRPPPSAAMSDGAVASDRRSRGRARRRIGYVWTGKPWCVTQPASPISRSCARRCDGEQTFMYMLMCLASFAPSNKWISIRPLEEQKPRGVR